MKKLYKSLPGWTYTSEAFFELEKNELILKNWQLVCHISNIPKAGDYFTFEIFNERIFAIRGEDKNVRAFHNFCSHRGTKLIDETFGNLIPNIDFKLNIPSKDNFPKGTQIEKKDFPQTAVLFGHKGLKRNHKDFFSARIINYVLGGGGFQSRMYKNVREKKGLVYSIYSYLVPYKNNDILLGGFQTRNKSVYEAISLVKEEWDKINKFGITKKEFEEAKTYYKGSFTRNFTSTSSISSLLKTVQVYNLDLEYFKNRNKIIDNLTLKEVNKVAKTLFKKNDLYFTIVGNVN